MGESIRVTECKLAGPLSVGFRAPCVRIRGDFHGLAFKNFHRIRI